MSDRSPKAPLRAPLPALLALATFCACAPPPELESADPAYVVKLQQAEHEVIYGEDTRLDVFEAPDELAERARRSIFAMISADRINQSNPSDVTFFAGSLGSTYGLCLDQRFRSQPTAASCSATLIEDDLIVTAGHCIGSQAECLSQRFVLGYLMEEDGLLTISSSDVFSCLQLVASYDDGEVDYAFVKLDRPVPITQGEPAPVRLSNSPLQEGEPLVMMGFPSGLPLKIDNGGFVSDPRPFANDYFMATVDAFGGNSGSGVFNEAGEQVGILVRGEQDYIQRGRCAVVNELSLDRGPGDSAEDITYLHRGLEALCESGYQSERLCDSNVEEGGLCSSCDPGRPCQEGLNCRGFSTLMTEVNFCAPGCANGEGCPSGHRCLEGQCEPNISRICDQDNNRVIGIDSCGRALGVIEGCDSSSYCRRGECLLRGEGDLCSTASEIEAISQELRGTLAEGYVNSLSGSCAGGGPERFYTFSLEEPNHLTALADGFDTVLYLLSGSGCEAFQELACDDDGHPESRLGSRLDLDLEAGDYTLVLDSFTADFVSDYTLSLSFCDEACTLGETRCEPDGRVSVCELSPGVSCPGWSRPLDCPSGLVCAERSCVSPQPGDTCDALLPLTAPYPEVIEGEVSALNTSAHAPRCAAEVMADVNYQLELPYDARVTVSYVSGPLSALSIRAGCGRESAELECTPQVIGASPLVAQLSAGVYTLTLSALDVGPYSVDLRVEPNCFDVCSEGELSCGQDRIELLRCALGPEGCFEWSFDRRCTGAGGCLAGSCVDECFHECDEGQLECLSLSERRACVADEQGCRRWEALESCEPDELCSLDGQCVGSSDGGSGGEQPIAGLEGGSEGGAEGGLSSPVAGDALPPANPWVGAARPSPVILPERVRGGCEQGPQPLSPLPLLSLLTLGLLTAHRRRSLGAPAR